MPKVYIFGTDPDCDRCSKSQVYALRKLRNYIDTLAIMLHSDVGCNPDCVVRPWYKELFEEANKKMVRVVRSITPKDSSSLHPFWCYHYETVIQYHADIIRTLEEQSERGLMVIENNGYFVEDLCEILEIPAVMDLHKSKHKAIKKIKPLVSI